MAKPSITTIIPGSTYSGGSLTIPSSFFTSAGLNTTTATSADGAKIIAALFTGLESQLKDKYLDIEYGVSCDGTFPSIGQKNDALYYEVLSYTFSIFAPRNTSTIDPDNVL